MKKNKLALVFSIIILILIGTFFLFFNKEKESIEKFTADTECIESGGQWIEGGCIEYNQERAQELKESCVQAGGDWMEDSYKYECSFDGDVFSNGSWAGVNWVQYNDIKKACLNFNGKYLGGLDMQCEIDNEIYSLGSFENLDYMKAVCEGYKGEWLGGPEFKCKFDEKIYSGDLVESFGLKKSCDEYPGIWLGGDNSSCKIDSHVYNFGSWRMIDEMEDSCLSYGGEYLGGPSFSCQIYDNIYQNKEWIRFSKAEDISDKCQNDGGDWIEESKTCQGLPLDWCVGIELQYEEIKGMRWDETTLSCSLII